MQVNVSTFHPLSSLSEGNSNERVKTMNTVYNVVLSSHFIDSSKQRQYRICLGSANDALQLCVEMKIMYIGKCYGWNIILQLQNLFTHPLLLAKYSSPGHPPYGNHHLIKTGS
jgi:hypothetical protein